ncbi:MAG: TlpA family protein disulfide reductase [Actinobacteria bacterium]|nr:TlpA family protein disulfide reductase [Actinomycetota bacterium]
MRSGRPRRWRLAAALSAAVLLAGCGGGGSGGSGGGLSAKGLDPLPTAVAPGGSVSALTFTRFDGTTGSFADYAGKVVVVNFWASWCVPCVKEMPDFEAVFGEFGGSVAFLGLNVQDQLADAQDLATRTGVTYDLARDPRGDLLRVFGGVAMPTTAFVRADGTVAAATSRTFDQAALRERIAEAQR